MLPHDIEAALHSLYLIVQSDDLIGEVALYLLGERPVDDVAKLGLQQLDIELVGSKGLLLRPRMDDGIDLASDGRALQYLF